MSIDASSQVPVLTKGVTLKGIVVMTVPGIGTPQSPGIGTGRPVIVVAGPDGPPSALTVL